MSLLDGVFALPYTLLRENSDGEEEEISVTVEYEYSPACKGSREYPGGPPIEPDEEEDVEVCTVTVQDGTEIVLRKGELETIEEACLKNIHENIESRAEALAEARAEARENY